MKGSRPYSSISRHRLLSTAAVLPTLPGLLFSTAARGQAPGGVLPFVERRVKPLRKFISPALRCLCTVGNAA
jgi:hypothetical protein